MIPLKKRFAIKIQAPIMKNNYRIDICFPLLNPIYLEPERYASLVATKISSKGVI